MSRYGSFWEELLVKKKRRKKAGSGERNELALI